MRPGIDYSPGRLRALMEDLGMLPDPAPPNLRARRRRRGAAMPSGRLRDSPPLPDRPLVGAVQVCTAPRAEQVACLDADHELAAPRTLDALALAAAHARACAAAHLSRGARRPKCRRAGPGAPPPLRGRTAAAAGGGSGREAGPAPVRQGRGGGEASEVGTAAAASAGVQARRHAAGARAVGQAGSARSGRGAGAFPPPPSMHQREDGCSGAEAAVQGHAGAGGALAGTARGVQASPWPRPVGL